MFVTTDRFLQVCARARRPVPFCTSVPVPAISSQIRQRRTGHPAAPQQALVIVKGSAAIKGSVVIPRPEGRGICFSSARQQSAPRVFSSLCTLSYPLGPEPTHIQSVTNPLLRAKSTTLAFPVTSELLAHSSAPERKSTPLFSIACALFCKNTGGGGLSIFRNSHSLLNQALSLTRGATGLQTWFTTDKIPANLPS